jgi:hypothetical protein
VSRRKRAITGAATAIGTAAALVAGYAAAGATGLVDVAALATLGVLIVARGAVRGEKPRSVRPKRQPKRQRRDPGRPAARATDFPAYTSMASDVEWARMSQRHYEHALRPRLARLAAAFGKSGAIDLTGPADPDGPGPDLATLERIVTHLEAP